MSTSLTFEIEAECDRCGSDLIASFDGNSIYIDPCEKCLSKERLEGHDEGKEEGYEYGHSKGYTDGFDDGVNSVKEEKE